MASFLEFLSHTYVSVSLCLLKKEKKQFYKGSKHAWNVKRQYCRSYTQQNMSPSEMGFSPDIKMESRA